MTWLSLPHRARSGSSAIAELPTVMPRVRLRFPQHAVGPLLAFIEIMSLTALSVACDLSYQALAFEDPSIDPRPFIVAFDMAALYVGLLLPYRFYRFEKLMGDAARVRWPLLAWALVGLAFTTIAFAFKLGSDFSRGSMLSFFVLGFVVIAVLRLSASRILRQAVASGRLDGRRIVVLGDACRITDPAIRDTWTANGYNVLAQFPMRKDGTPAEELEGAVSEVVKLARAYRFDEIHLVMPWSDQASTDRALNLLRVLPIAVHLIPDPSICHLFSHPVTNMGPFCAVELQRIPLTALERWSKRTFDILAASAALLALSPLFAFVAILIKLDSPGPVFFLQTRVGFSGRSFRIWKFRSMTTLDDGAVVKQATQADPRVTRVGRWLRQSSIDELPQLLNVLLGHMSLVGPRPHALAHDNIYTDLIASYAYRHHVRPGITGWAQVNGLRGETPTIDLMERRVQYDLWYIANWSFWLDLRTLFKTIGSLVRPHNVY